MSSCWYNSSRGNLLEPLILSKAIALHPLLVISSVSAGAVAFGVLGAFLASRWPRPSPASSIIYAAGSPDAGPGSDDRATSA